VPQVSGIESTKICVRNIATDLVDVYIIDCEKVGYLQFALCCVSVENMHQVSYLFHYHR